jgi:hypothetical protein
MRQGIAVEGAEGASAAGPELNEAHGSEIQGAVVVRRVDELRPHPSFARHHLTIPASAVSAAASQTEFALREPLVITQQNVILKGYPQWQLARIKGLESIRCIEHALFEDEALHWLLQSHRRLNGLNDFARIVLALDLEPGLQEKARSNQRTGGQHKGSSTLAKALRLDVRSQIAVAAGVSTGNVTKVKQTGGQHKGSSTLAKALRLDVRSQIAVAAGVSTGNVTKVKQLVQNACPDLLQALRLGQLSIHRAWQWSEETPEQQRRRLFQHLGERGVRKTIRQLVSRHCAEETRPILAFHELLRWMSEIDPTHACDIQIAVVETPGLTIFISQELFRAIDSQRELRL